ncbi:MAG: hypothetical protein LQ351_007528 [Letrouitia transgressa]|nr:MAG: hypothetical protein LQ351_007528 [Letrouitia transgressa]
MSAARIVLLQLLLQCSFALPSPAPVPTFTTTLQDANLDDVTAFQNTSASLAPFSASESTTGLSSLDPAALFAGTLDVPPGPHYVRSSYRVPGTDIILEIIVDEVAPFEAAAMGRTLLRAQQDLRNHLHIRGDGWTQPVDEPFQRDDRGTGKCFIGMHSIEPVEPQGPAHFKYSTMLASLEGIWQFLFLGRRRYEAIWQTFDHRVKIGYGKILRSNMPHASHVV